MRSTYAQFQALGATVVAVSQDDAEDVNEYWQENNIPFLCLPDPEGTLKALYHQKSNMGPLPAVFIIGKSGKIHLAHYGTSMKDIPTADALLKLLKPLQASDNGEGVRSTSRQPSMTQDRSDKEMENHSNSNIGNQFPDVTAKSLSGDRVSIPASSKGKITLVAVAFLRENQGQLDSWLNPFYEKFSHREGFTFYEVPMISSGYKFMKFLIDGGMRGGLPDFKHKHVVTMYGDVEHYTKTLNLDPRNGYAFLLDRQGVIRWQGHGYATKEMLDSLFGEVRRLEDSATSVGSSL